MKVNFKINRIKVIAALAIMVSIHPFWVASSMAQAVKSTTEKPESNDQFVSIDFNNVDINVFIKFMSELTGTNFVVDQRVKGKVSWRFTATPRCNPGKSLKLCLHRMRAQKALKPA
jgi:type II secretory pathway component GspD/PulD (secretin)